MGDPGAAADDHKTGAKALRLQKLDKFGHVLDVHVLLGHGLGHQQHVCVQLYGLLHEVLVLHLGPQVVGFDHLVALETVVAREALPVHDGVDAHGVGVGARGRADEHQLPAEVAADVVVDLLHGHDAALHGLDLDVLVVHRVDAGAVDHVEGEILVQLHGTGHVGLLKAHLPGQLPGGLHAPLVVLHRQGEAQLHLAVVHGVAVGLDPSEIEGPVKALDAHIVESAAHLAPPVRRFRKGL